MPASFFKSYSHFAANHPFIILGMVVLLTFGAVQGASRIRMEGTAFSKMFPPELEVMKNLRVVQDDFLGTTSIIIAVEVDPDDPGPAAIVDVRDPMVMRYVAILAEKSSEVDNAISAASAADIVKAADNGIIPGSKRTIVSTLDASSDSSRYISDDYTMSLVRLSLGNVDEKEEDLIASIREVISTTTAPPGIKAGITGEPTITVVFKESTGPDMQRTSTYSFIGILIIAILLFMSIKHGVMPIISVGVGLVWAYGLMGFLGISLSSTMAGFGSMVMGIGIDFAIQVVSRYRDEIAGFFKHENGHETPEEALAFTLSAVIGPMSTTTLAALIGFRAMSLGTLKMMGDLGTVMSLGVLASMMAAITLVPSLLMISEKI